MHINTGRAGIWLAALLIALGIGASHLIDGPSDVETAQRIESEAERLEVEASALCKELLGVTALHYWTRDNRLRCAVRMSSVGGDL